jgi:hypothetical protein
MTRPESSRVPAATDLLFISDRTAAQVAVCQCSDERLLARVRAGPHPNGLAFDASRRQLFSLNLRDPVRQGCTASVVSLDRQEVVATLGIDPGHHAVYALLPAGSGGRLPRPVTRDPLPCVRRAARGWCPRGLTAQLGCNLGFISGGVPCL